jgi:hypothetical protein
LVCLAHDGDVDGDDEAIANAVRTKAIDEAGSNTEADHLERGFGMAHGMAGSP